MSHKDYEAKQTHNLPRETDCFSGHIELRSHFLLLFIPSLQHYTIDHWLKYCLILLKDDTTTVSLNRFHNRLRVETHSILIVSITMKETSFL